MLSSILHRFFDSGSRDRGLQYFRSNYVHLNHGNDTIVEAIVEGTDDYQVSLHVKKKTLLGSCTCPRFAEGGSCKHIWATILASEKKSHLLNHGKPVTNYEDDWDNIAEELEDEDYDDDNESWYSPQPVKTKKPAKTATKKAPQKWLTLFQSIHQQASQSKVEEQRKPVWPADRRAIYLIRLPPKKTPGYSAVNQDQLVVELMIQDRKKDGNWSKPKPASMFFACDLPDPIDQQLQTRLPQTPAYYSNYSYGYDSQASPVVKLKAYQEQAIVELMCRSGRCFLKIEAYIGDRDFEMVPIAWDDGLPWQWHLSIETKKEGKEFVCQPVLLRGQDKAVGKDIQFYTQGGLAVFRNHVSRYDHGNAFDWVKTFKEQGELTVPTSKADELIKQLHAGIQVPRIVYPPELRFETVISKPKPIAQISPHQWNRGTNSDRHHVAVLMDYDGVRYKPDSCEMANYNVKEKRLLRRDAEAEALALARLPQLGVRAESYDRFALSIASKQLPKLVNNLANEGWQIELEGKKIRSASGAFQFEVNSGIDWFELHGNMPFGETQATLPRLLAALRKGEQYVVLEDGSLGQLPEEFKKEFGLLMRLGEDNKDHVRFKSSQAGLLDALLASRPEARCDATFKQVRQELSQFEGIEALKPPATFQGELRPYQEVGLGWFDFLRRFNFGGCLADDMGLGKTVQVLALLEQRRLAGIKKPTLVVVPRSLIFNWKQEAARFAPELKILDHSERVRTKSNEHFEDYDIILTTYAILRMDILFFEKYGFDYVILDEAHAVKNDKSESAKAARLLQADHRLALSGTPIENHLGELWSMFEYLNPGMLGTASVFKLAGNRQDSQDDQRLPLLARALRPFILRRTKEQVAKDLPAKMEQTIYCEMEPAHRKLYNELRDDFRNKLLGRVATLGMNRSKIYVLEALLRLRQAACHPALLDKKQANEPGTKLETLFNHLEEVLAEGRKVLVFSQFTSFLKILRGHLNRKGIDSEYLDGATKNRQEIVDRFQNDKDSQLFLISLKAGGLGLNLTAAEYVFLLDPWWNPAAEAQAIDRAHRIGQQKQVFAYRLIVKDTVEEKVLQLQQKKRQLADAIISADQGMLKTLEREDLELLLS